jgi:hypothetical protein
MIDVPPDRNYHRLSGRHLIIGMRAGGGAKRKMIMNINKKLLELLTQYPNAGIMTFTNYDVVCDDWGYWQGEIENCYYGKIYHYGDNFYFDLQSVREVIEEEIDNDNKINEILQNIKTDEGIIIKIGI